MDTTYIYILSYLHVERNSSTPCDVPPTAWKLQWPKLVLWSPSLQLVKRSHCSKFLGIGRIPWQLNLHYNLEEIHHKKTLSWIPIYIWLAYSLVDDWLVPMSHSSRENGIPPSWLFSKLNHMMLLHMFVGPIQSLYNTFQKINGPWH